jgi:hypothetical protein
MDQRVTAYISRGCEDAEGGSIRERGGATVIYRSWRVLTRERTDDTLCVCPGDRAYVVQYRESALYTCCEVYLADNSRES